MWRVISPMVEDDSHHLAQHSRVGFLHLIYVHLAPHERGSDAPGGCEDQLLLVNVGVAALLKNEAVLGADPAVSLLSNVPIELRRSVLRKGIFAVMVSERWPSMGEFVDEKIQL